MKLRNKILIIILIVIIIFAILFIKLNKDNKMQNKRIDLISTTCTDIKSHPSLEKDDLKVTLMGFYVEAPQSREEFINDIGVENRLNDIEKYKDSSTGEEGDEIDWFLKTFSQNHINAIIEFKGIDNQIAEEKGISYRVYNL